MIFKIIFNYLKVSKVIFYLIYETLDLVKDSVQVQTRHVFVKRGCPGSNRIKIFCKNLYNLKVLHFDPAHSQGQVMSMKCEEPIDKLTVQVW